jgi:hypothetical protein
VVEVPVLLETCSLTLKRQQSCHSRARTGRISRELTATHGPSDMATDLYRSRFQDPGPYSSNWGSNLAGRLNTTARFRVDHSLTQSGYLQCRLPAPLS